MGAPPTESDQSRSSTRRKWIGGCLIAFVLIAFVGIQVLSYSGVFCALGICPETPWQAASEQAHQAAIIASYGGPPLATCGNEPVSVHPRGGGLTVWNTGEVYVGLPPVWLNILGLALENGHAVVHMEGYVEKKINGFPMYLTWINGADYAEVIHVRVTDQQTGVELRTEPDVGMHDADLLVPAEEAAISTGQQPPFRRWVTVATFPKSPHCYVATASWPGGNWSVAFGIGR